MRIYVTQSTQDVDDYATVARTGYFTHESATYWHGNKECFDGANLADVNTRNQNTGEGLYRTAGGRWVRRTWSNWQGDTETHEYVDETAAQDWLLFNGYDDAVREHFGEPEEERGPGRPTVGPAFPIRLPADLLAEFDLFWKSAGAASRSEAIRELVAMVVGRNQIS